MLATNEKQKPHVISRLKSGGGVKGRLHKRRQAVLRYLSESLSPHLGEEKSHRANKPFAFYTVRFILSAQNYLRADPRHYSNFLKRFTSYPALPTSRLSVGPNTDSTVVKTQHRIMPPS